MMMSITKATCIGVCAIAIWSTFAALIRDITEHFGVLGGAALIYTVSSVFLCLYNRGLPNIRRFPKVYLLFCGLLFVAYEILLSFAIGIAKTKQQFLEVNLINYLWPCLVILLSIFINKQKVTLLFWPGLCLSFLGVVWSISGDEGLSVLNTMHHIKADPLPYLLAFIGAFLWGLYCNLSKHYSNGNNGIPIFFIVIASVLWLQYFIHTGSMKTPSVMAIIELLIVGVLIAVSYGCWEVGIQKGNMLLLAVFSYFTPVSSILFATFWFNTPLTLSFWYGVCMVTLGSLLCWFSTIIISKQQNNLPEK